MSERDVMPPWPFHALLAGVQVRMQLSILTQLVLAGG